MYFNSFGLVTDDQGDQFLFIPWLHIHGVWRWMKENKDWRLYPGQVFDREQVGFILAHYEDELN